MQNVPSDPVVGLSFKELRRSGIPNTKKVKNKTQVPEENTNDIWGACSDLAPFDSQSSPWCWLNSVLRPCPGGRVGVDQGQNGFNVGLEFRGVGVGSGLVWVVSNRIGLV